MPRVSPALGNFTAGELSPKLAGRTDAERYKSALSRCENYIVTRQGYLTRRPGTVYCANTRSSSSKSRLLPFKFSTEQAYILEFGHQFIRFYRNNGQILNTPKVLTAITKANPGVVISTGHGFTNGTRVVIYGVPGMSTVNNREFTVVGATANTFELSDEWSATVDTTGYDACTGSGYVASIVEIASPYTASDLPLLQITQSLDVLFITHPSYETRLLSRLSHTSWTLTTINIKDGPYLPKTVAQESITLTTSGIAAGASGNVTASSALFVSTDVNRLIRLKHISPTITWGWGKITAFVSSTVVTVTATTDINSGVASDWALGAYSATTGYPSAIAFYQDRLVLAKGVRVDFSRSGVYDSFLPTQTDASVTADLAVSVGLNTGEMSFIQWVRGTPKGVIAGTSDQELLVTQASTADAFGPANVDANPVSAHGSAASTPIRAEDSLLFIQRSREEIREMVFGTPSGGIRAEELSVLAKHATETGVTEMAFTVTPHPILWCIRNDGNLVGMTYARESDYILVGWHRHTLGGYRTALGGSPAVESITVIPSADGTYDELWLIVRRWINGRSVRSVEYLHAYRKDSIGQHQSFHIDMGLSGDAYKLISNATQTNPVTLTVNAHGYTAGDLVYVNEVTGMTQLNHQVFQVSNPTANTFDLLSVEGTPVDGTGYGSYAVTALDEALSGNASGKVWKQYSTFSGFNHLLGGAVGLLVDGGWQDASVSSLGKITLSVPGGILHAGLAFESQIKTLRIDAGSADGTAIGKKQRWPKFNLMLFQTQKIKYGASLNTMFDVEFEEDSVGGVAPLLFAIDESNMVELSMEGDFDKNSYLYLVQDKTLPGTILGIFPQLLTQDMA